MARWQRDPKARRTLAWVLVATESLVLTLNAYPVFSAYLNYVSIYVLGTVRAPLVPYRAALVVNLVAMLLILAAAVLAGAFYVRGRIWPRVAYIGANLVMLVLGVMWFAHNRFASASPEPKVALAGLLLPLVTVFPLLWPLLVFRPVPPPPGGGAPPED